MNERTSQPQSEGNLRGGIFLMVLLIVGVVGLMGGIVAGLALLPIALIIGIWLLVARGSAREPALHAGATDTEELQSQAGNTDEHTSDHDDHIEDIRRSA